MGEIAEQLFLLPCQEWFAKGTVEESGKFSWQLVRTSFCKTKSPY
jgi:hypothetical protein